jgi:hypothetical protein
MSWSAGSRGGRCGNLCPGSALAGAPGAAAKGRPLMLGTRSSGVGYMARPRDRPPTRNSGRRFFPAIASPSDSPKDTRVAHCGWLSEMGPQSQQESNRTLHSTVPPAAHALVGRIVESSNGGMGETRGPSSPMRQKWAKKCALVSKLQARLPTADASDQSMSTNEVPPLAD